MSEQEAALEKLDLIDARGNAVARLREEANTLIEEHIPAVWRDGETRTLNSDLYKELKRIMQELQVAEGLLFAGRETPLSLGGDICYVGQFGTLWIKELTKS